MPTFMRTSRFSHPMGEDADDVRRALTIVYRGHEGIPQADVERIFSFDMEWVAPHEAEDVVNALLNAGWLKSDNGQLHLAVELGEVEVPFGWFPRPTRLMHPVSATASPSHRRCRCPRCANCTHCVCAGCDQTSGCTITVSSS